MYYVFRKLGKINKDYFIILFFIITAISIRLYRIGNFELWLDEAFTYHEMITTNFFSDLLNDNSPPLYYILLRMWGSAIGYSELAIRIPSALFGGLFVAITYVVAKDIFDENTGKWCGVLSLLSPIAIYYSQEARCYSLFILMIILTYWMVWKAQESDKLTFWVLSSIFATLTLYTHTLALLIIFATISFIILSSRLSGKLILKWFIYLLVIPIALFLPWIVSALFLTTHSKIGADWIAYIWANTPAILAIPMSLDAFSFLTTNNHVLYVKGGDFIYYNEFMSSGGKYLTRIFLSVLLLFIIVPYYDKYMTITNISRKKYMFLLAFFMPLAMLLIISFVKPLYVVSRYDMISFPPFILMTGLALSKMQSLSRAIWKPLIIITTVFWFVPVSMFIYYYDKMPRRLLHAPRAQSIISAVSNNDIVVFTGLETFPQLYYLDMSGLECRNWQCVNASGTTKFFYRFFPLANEQSGGAYNERAYIGLDRQQKIAEEWDEIIKMRRDIDTTILLSFDAAFYGTDIAFNYPLDYILFNTIKEHNVKRNYISTEFPIVLCRTGQD